MACTCYRCRYEICQKALESISTRDPQSDACGGLSPDVCLMNCIGCEARKALKNSAKTRNPLASKLGWSKEDFDKDNVSRCPTCGDVQGVRHENVGDCPDEWHKLSASSTTRSVSPTA